MIPPVVFVYFKRVIRLKTYWDKKTGKRLASVGKQ